MKYVFFLVLKHKYTQLIQFIRLSIEIKFTIELDNRPDIHRNSGVTNITISQNLALNLAPLLIWNSVLSNEIFRASLR